jgi:tRNA/tmRNA/rRNA uracil-C5-methylase (TrmA/RlmC/RlmD family)
MLYCAAATDGLAISVARTRSKLRASASEKLPLLLELYCGNGNFSLALARNFDRVLATEIAKPSVAAAQYNIAANHIDNVQIIRMAAEEFTHAPAPARSYRCRSTIPAGRRSLLW